MVVKEIQAKSILSASKVYPYVLNPYVGCQFGCRYCYARFMKKFTGHTEPWGTFVDVKVNAAELLERELRKKKPDEVWISGVCDPYQPLEVKYQLTRSCLALLVTHRWPVRIQTKSPLVLRDVDIFTNADTQTKTGEEKSPDCHVGVSIATGDEEVRRIFEPDSPSLVARMDALRQLHAAGIRTYVMIAPILPGAERLIPQLEGIVDYVYVDRMNYGYADSIYRMHGLDEYRTDLYFNTIGQAISQQCQDRGIPCSICF